MWRGVWKGVTRHASVPPPIGRSDRPVRGSRADRPTGDGGRPSCTRTEESRPRETAQWAGAGIENPLPRLAPCPETPRRHDRGVAQRTLGRFRWRPRRLGASQERWLSRRDQRQTRRRAHQGESRLQRRYDQRIPDEGNSDRDGVVARPAVSADGRTRKVTIMGMRAIYFTPRGAFKTLYVATSAPSKIAKH